MGQLRECHTEPLIPAREPAQMPIRLYNVRHMPETRRGERNPSTARKPSDLDSHPTLDPLGDPEVHKPVKFGTRRTQLLAPFGSAVAPSFGAITSTCPAFGFGFCCCRPIFGTLG